MKSNMGFPLTPRLMTLDDLELHKFEFLVNFAGFRTEQQLNAWRWASIVSDNVVSTSNWSNFWQTFVSRGFVSDSWAFLFFFCDELANWKTLYSNEWMKIILSWYHKNHWKTTAFIPDTFVPKTAVFGFWLINAATTAGKAINGGHTLIIALDSTS